MKIISKNQKGGITAQNVSMGKDSQFTFTQETRKKKNWIKPFAIIAGIVAFIASIVAILSYLNIFLN